MINDGISLLLQLVAAGGGGAAIAFVLFQYLSKSWLDNKFAERLAALQHQHNLEVARLRVEIDSMLNGALTMQKKEFELLPIAWELFEKAYSQIDYVTSPMQTYADIDSMNDRQVEEMLFTTEFSESQKQDVRESVPKSKKFVEYLIQERAYKAHQHIAELGKFLSLNGILLPIEIKEKLNSVYYSLSKIGNSVRFSLIYKRPHEVPNQSEKVEALLPLRAEIESLIQKRLASHATASITL